jgi:hypothetical protein
MPEIDGMTRQPQCKQEMPMTKTVSPATTELSLHEMAAVAGGAKGDSGALDAAKKIDLSAFLAQLDRAIEKARHI